MTTGNSAFAFGIACLAAAVFGIGFVSPVLGEWMAIASAAVAVLCVGVKYRREA